MFRLVFVAMTKQHSRRIFYGHSRRHMQRP
jgi:hypothetical protein